MVLFNNGSNTDRLPSFQIEGINLQYKQSVKFLGVYLSAKLSWNAHIEYILAKARKGLNFIKIISKQHWGQDTSTLIHLATSLVRSKLCYAQEIFFSAPNYLLKKIQSIDCKAFKFALGLPIHASCLRTYMEAGVLPLDEYRKAASSKYIVRSTTTDINTEEINIKSDIDFPKRARSISSYVTLNTFISSSPETQGLITKEKKIAQRPFIFPTPSWELQRPMFDIEYTDIVKEDNSHLLTSTVKSHLDSKYSHHLKIYTDGSKLENRETGAAFLIPDLKVEKYYYLGKDRSIFTAELVAILMALNFIIDFPKNVYQIVFCVDSKSVLSALKSLSLNVRSEMIIEISQRIHELVVKGTQVTFCWVPSHSGIYFNDKVDIAAKLGAKQNEGSIVLDIPLSLHELYSTLNCNYWNSMKKKCEHFSNNHINFNVKNLNKVRLKNGQFIHRHISSLMCRWKFNAFRTKYVNDVSCLCKAKLSPEHLLHCNDIKQLLPVLNNFTVDNIFSDILLASDFFQSLISSSVGCRL